MLVRKSIPAHPRLSHTDGQAEACRTSGNQGNGPFAPGISCDLSHRY
ncbi:MAG: hypothetical protein J5I41_05870 [Saprospiraceae bacterium]|nr:hypothetical protein [Saprospiraceae bacterium]